MKTIIFYVRKGGRTAKQQGLATAPGSAVTIRTLSEMALRGGAAGTTADILVASKRAWLRSASLRIGGHGVMGLFMLRSLTLSICDRSIARCGVNAISERRATRGRPPLIGTSTPILRDHVPDACAMLRR